MAAGLRLHLCPRLRAFASSSRPLLTSHHPGSLPTRRAGPSMPLAARARRGLGTSLAAAPPAEADDFATAADLQFDPPLEVVKYPDPVLRAPNKRVNTFDDNLRALTDEMFDVMYKTDGIGLSAPQVGVNVQLMVFNPAGVKGEGEEIILVNPVIYKSSKRLILFEEGCLSFPGIYANVVRPDIVKIEAQDATGAKIKVKLSGLPARVFQHEFDHLQGILFFDRMTMDVLESIREDLKDLEKKYEERTGLTSPETVENIKGYEYFCRYVVELSYNMRRIWDILLYCHHSVVVQMLAVSLCLVSATSLNLQRANLLVTSEMSFSMLMSAYL